MSHENNPKKSHVREVRAQTPRTAPFCAFALFCLPLLPLLSLSPNGCRPLRSHTTRWRVTVGLSQLSIYNTLCFRLQELFWTLSSVFSTGSDPFFPPLLSTSANPTMRAKWRKKRVRRLKRKRRKVRARSK